MRQIPDYVQRRVIIEYGRKYVYATLSDANGKIVQEELFTQPYTLEPRDAQDEAKECWQAMYQYLSDVLVFPTARSDEPDGTQDS